MFGLDTKSLLIGIALGWLILPRLQGALMSKMSNA